MSGPTDSDLPDGWESTKIEFVSSIYSGHAFPKRYQGETAGQIPFAKVSDISNACVSADHILGTAANYVSEEVATALGARPVPTRVVVFAKIGEAIRLNRRAWTARPIIIDNNVMAVGANPRALQEEFLFFWFQNMDLYPLALGGTVPSLRKATIAQLDIHIPPRAEQRRIVAKIEALQQRSHKARAALESIPPLLESFRRSVLAAAFRGELTSDWRARHPDVEPASVLLERMLVERRRRWEEAELAKMAAKGKVPKNDKWKSKYQEPVAPDVEGLPEIPEGWCWAAAEQIVEPGADIVYGIVQPGPVVEGGVPYVRGKDIQEGRILVEQLRRTSTAIAAKYSRASLKSGDVLLGIIRATKVAIVPKELEGGNLTQGTARFRPSSIIRTSYLALWLDSPWAQSWLHSHYRGIDMPGLNLRDVRRLPVPLAPLAEQQRTAGAVDERLQRIASLRRVVSRLERQSNQLDDSILKTAFEGKLVPQDPNDEPASVLLERIRKAREAETPKKKRRKTKR